MSSDSSQFAVYQQAEKNLKKNPHSAVDSFIVDLWNASKTLFKENVNLKQELKDTQYRAAGYWRRIDVLETKVDTLTKGKQDVAI